MIDFRYLPAFIAVAEMKSFTEAGKALHIATSAVSRQIRLLEEACQTQLVFRSPHNVSLTQAGKLLYEETKRFNSESNRIIGADAVEQLKIGMLQGVLENWFIDFIGKHSLFKNMNLEIDVDKPDQLIEKLDSGLLDLSLFSFANRSNVPMSFRIFRLFRENIILISRDKVDIGKLNERTWICLTKKTWIIQHQERLPSRSIIVNNMSSVVELVRKGLGVAMVPAYVVPNRKGLQTQVINEFSKEYICLVAKRYEREPPIHTVILAMLKVEFPEFKEIQ